MHFVLFFIMSSLFSVSLVAQQAEKFTIDGMIGEPPARVALLIKQLKEKQPTTTTDTDKRLKNRLILYGPPGNGKTTLAFKIAQMTDSLFFKIDGPTIVDKYVGQGSQNIAQVFDLASEKAREDGKRVIIFIDEIDAIASNNKSEYRSEHAAALQQLWLELDRYKKDPYIFVMCATNHFKKLDKTFLDRFGANAIEIPNPDLTLRRQALQFYCDNAGVTLKPDDFETLAKKSEGLSMRCLEDLVDDVAALAAVTNKPVEQKTLMAELVRSKEKFEGNAHDDNSENRDKQWQRVSTYVSVVGGLLGIVINTKHIIDMITASRAVVTPAVEFAA